LQARSKPIVKQLACKIPRCNLYVIARLMLHRVTCAVPAGRLDAELLNVTKRVTNVLQMLPKNITPVNLEELRRVKQQLVELESRAENIV